MPQDGQPPVQKEILNHATLSHANLNCASQTSPRNQVFDGNLIPSLLGQPVIILNNPQPTYPC
jgi:hypothetical protein